LGGWWVRQYSAANFVGARQEAPLFILVAIFQQAMRTRCKNDRINNIGTKVPQSESSKDQIGQGRIGTFAREGIGVGAKTAYGKRPPATHEIRLGLRFSVRLGFRVRLRVRVRIRVTKCLYTRLAV